MLRTISYRQYGAVDGYLMYLSSAGPAGVVAPREQYEATVAAAATLKRPLCPKQVFLMSDAMPVTLPTGFKQRHYITGSMWPYSKVSKPEHSLLTWIHLTLSKDS
jgi:hypothetical protein